MDILAKSGGGGGEVVGAIFAFILVAIILMVLVARVREAISPRRVGNRMARFFEGATPAMLKEVAKRAAVRALQGNPAHAKGAVLRVSGNDLLVAFRQVQAMRPVENAPS